MRITFSEIGTVLSSSLASRLLGPSFTDKGRSDAGCYYEDLELILEEDSYPIQVDTRLFVQVVVEHVDN
jgi:hypothetical protein